MVTTHYYMGRDKRAYIAALRQAKFYPPWQAAAAADRALRAAIHKLLHSTSCFAARALRQPQCTYSLHSKFSKIR